MPSDYSTCHYGTTLIPELLLLHKTPPSAPKYTKHKQTNKEYEPCIEANWAKYPDKGAQWRTSPPPLHPDTGEKTQCLKIMIVQN